MLPLAPLIVMKSVLVVVAPPQATGVCPKWSSLPLTTRVACEPGVIAAVTDLVVGS